MQVNAQIDAILIFAQVGFFIGVLYTLSTADLQDHFFCTKHIVFRKRWSHLLETYLEYCNLSWKARRLEILLYIC
jgi:hypothetical protein